ncbi:hypothetical protein C7212DRAFT_306700 [Tuber magnatum]|uniref:Uncharacterized protein n=1 Tax=Tuber magnatum TaxID=42249 RepID=A0A317T292_9PEZI|nr:hypothetical protein C7212DRAFT_306700 [Tuber magnatum]
MSSFDGDRRPSLRKRHACGDLAALSRQHASIPLGTVTGTQEPIVAATQPNVQPVAVATNQPLNGAGVGNATQIANQNPYIVYGTYTPLTSTNNYTGFPPNQQLAHQIYQLPNQQSNSYVYQPTQQLSNYQPTQQSNYQQNQQLSSLGGQVLSLPAGAGTGIGMHGTSQNSNPTPESDQLHHPQNYWLGSQDK